MGNWVMEDIHKLVRQCQDGQLEAFASLFGRYQNRVYDLASAILRDEKAAEDIVQDTFLAVFQQINRFKGESTFETWMTAIAVNHCRTRLRRRKLRQVLSLEQLSPARLLGLSDRQENVADLVHRRQRRETLWQSVDELPERLRLPIILRYRYGYNCDDIAHILGKRLSTIYQQLHEARRRLAEAAAPAESGRTAVAETGS